MTIVSWHLVQNGAQRGAIGDAELRQMAADGRLSRTDLLWRDGMTQWAAAGTLPGLFPANLPPPIIQPQAVNYFSPPPAGYRPQDDLGQNAGIRMLIPVGRSAWAIAAGYLGLLSFVIVPAPLALIFSIIAMIDIRKHPEKHGMGRAIFALIMGALGSAFLLFALVAGIFGNHR